MKNNKWINGAIPALLIHCTVGSVYAWSLFVNPISKIFGNTVNVSLIQFAFSLAIFFLGMSSAFLGRIVEKNVKVSALISAATFTSGLIITGIGVKFRSLALIYLGYGFLMGIGLGVGYITPVKTLMMWFDKNKGLATGIAITGFGFASTIASPLITFLMNKTDLYNVFFILGVIYLIPLLLSSLLIKKPYKDTINNKNFSYRKILKDKLFIFIWLIMFINITCGLSLISSASMILSELNISVINISIVIGIMGIFNGAGRLVLSTISDKCKNRESIYLIIFIVSMMLSLFSFSMHYFTVIILTLFIISATYGAGFSCLPALLSDKYGMDNISKIHGLCLTSWSFAGLCGNQLATFIKSITNSYIPLMYIIMAMYGLGFMFTVNVRNSKKAE